jgi:hypothetical protein
MAIIRARINIHLKIFLIVLMIFISCTYGSLNHIWSSTGILTSNSFILSSISIIVSIRIWLVEKIKETLLRMLRTLQDHHKTLVWLEVLCVSYNTCLCLADILDLLLMCFLVCLQAGNRLSTLLNFENESYHGKTVRPVILIQGNPVVVRNVSICRNYMLTDWFEDHPYVVVPQTNTDMPVY